MTLFLIDNIDAFIPIAIAFTLAIHGYLNRNSSKPEQRKFLQKIPLISGVLLVIGIVYLIQSSQVQYEWQNAWTDDRVAKARFPGTPEREEYLDQAPGISIHRIARGLSLRNGKLYLSLSYNEPGANPQSQAEKLEGIRQGFLSQDFEIVEDVTMPNQIHKLVLLNRQKNAQIEVRYRSLPTGDYRAMATAIGFYRQDKRIEPFLTSFRINSPGD